MKIQPNKWKLWKLLSSYKLELIVLIIGTSHQIMEKILKLSIPYIDSYLDDVIAVPFFSSSILIIENFSFYHIHTRKHTINQLFTIFVFISILFEYIIPKYSSAYTFDYWDILCYFLGMFGYYYLNKKAPINRGS